MSQVIQSAGPALRLPQPQSRPLPPSVLRLMRGPIVVGLIIVAAFFGIFGTWAAMAPLASGAIASGTVSPSSSRKVIQHLEGGIIRTIHVHEGQTVKAGDPLVTLESVQAQAKVTAERQQWLRLLVSRARLEALSNTAEALTIPPQAAALADVDLQSFVANEQHLFETQRDFQVQQSEIAGRKKEQLQSQITALEASNKGIAAQIEIVEKQLAGTQQLLDQQLIPASQVTANQRDLLDLQVQLQTNTANIAGANQAIAEGDLNLLSIQNQLRKDVQDETARTNNQIAVIDGDLLSSDDILERTVITSPVDGVVLNMRGETLGGVVRGGEPIMDIVPLDEDMIILAHLQPKDLDLVTVGLKAHVTLTPFSSRNLLPLNGEVIQIAPDSTLDEMTRQYYYEIRVKVPASEIAQHKGMFMSPGMPADVTVVTGERTMLQYLSEPFTRAIRNAFVYD